MRELWHYGLALEGFDRDLLLAHLWEIVGIEYDYLFLTQNCASRIARTLELVIDADLSPGLGLWVAPETVINAIGQFETPEGKPLLSSVEYRPSRRRATEQAFWRLSARERRAAEAAWPAFHQLNLDHPDFSLLEPIEQAAVVDVWLSHLNYLRQTEKDLDHAEIERTMLRHRLELPVRPRSAPPAPPTPIHEARPTGRVAVGSALYRGKSPGLRLGFRPLQYDLLDSDDSRQPDASLELLSLDLSLHNEAVRLRRLDLFRISNLHSERVPLPGSRGAAWRVAGGWDTFEIACIECRPGAVVTALAGGSQRTGADLRYWLAGVRLNDQRFQSRRAATVVEAGWMIDLDARHRVLFNLEHQNAFSGRDDRRTRVGVDWRTSLSLNRDLRLHALGDIDSGQFELAVSVGRYF